MTILYYFISIFIYSLCDYQLNGEDIFFNVKKNGKIFKNHTLNKKKEIPIIILNQLKYKFIIQGTRQKKKEKSCVY